MTDLLEAHYNTARSLAHQMRIPTDSIDFDDFIQEGVIAAWTATLEERRDPVTYGMVVAKRRIVGSLRGKHPMYGSEAEAGKRIYDQFRKVDQRDSYEDLYERAWRGDAYVEIERRVDVERALAGLGDRDQEIVRLVGLGEPWEAIAARVGMSKDGCWNRWRRILKPELAERLSAA